MEFDTLYSDDFEDFLCLKDTRVLVSRILFFSCTKKNRLPLRRLDMNIMPCQIFRKHFKVFYTLVIIISLNSQRCVISPEPISPTCFHNPSIGTTCEVGARDHRAFPAGHDDDESIASMMSKARKVFILAGADEQ